MSVNGHNFNSNRRIRGWGDEGKRVPNTGFDNSEKREIEIREFRGKKLGGDARAVQRGEFPGGREAFGVIGVEVSEEIDLTAV